MSYVCEGKINDVVYLIVIFTYKLNRVCYLVRTTILLNMEEDKWTNLAEDKLGKKSTAT